MIEAPHYSAAGEKRSQPFSLPGEVFDGTVNEDVLHQAVKTFLNNQRQGTAKAKTRTEVSGGNQKPWKQKGTGRARAGSTRAPHWRGGGIAFGPIPRSYRSDLPRKVRQLARRSALNARAREGMLAVIDPLAMASPKTQALLALLAKLELGTSKTLILTAGAKPAVYLSGRNVPHITVLPFSDATAYDILHAEMLVIEASALASDLVAGSDDVSETARPKAKRPAAKSRAAAKPAKVAKPTAAKSKVNKPKATTPKATKAAAKPKRSAAKKRTD
jgi:large subunit ribosomal protein L4